MDIDPTVKITRVTWTDLIDVSLYSSHAENVGVRMKCLYDENFSAIARISDGSNHPLLLKGIKRFYVNFEKSEVGRFWRN